MATFRDLLSQTKSQITEIEPAEAEALRAQPATAEVHAFVAAMR